MSRATGFAPIADEDARLLILGSLPSVRSLEAGEYYAHPQNAFWRIMGVLFGAGRDLPYSVRAEKLKANRIAVWDVLAASVRRGSMDADIDESTASANDFSLFYNEHRNIRMIVFNGQTAARLYEKKALPKLQDAFRNFPKATLPSTSPAFASMRIEQKLNKWAIVREVASEGGQ